MKSTAKNIFERLSESITKWAGSTSAFLLASSLIVIWLIGGLFFGYGDFYQLIANTFTTLVTFLMVFLIQRSQNKDVLALNLKLDELIRAVGEANNRIILVESLSEAELNALRKHYASLGGAADSPSDRAP